MSIHSAIMSLQPSLGLLSINSRLVNAWCGNAPDRLLAIQGLLDGVLGNAFVLLGLAMVTGPLAWSLAGSGLRVPEGIGNRYARAGTALLAIGFGLNLSYALGLENVFNRASVVTFLSSGAGVGMLLGGSAALLLLVSRRRFEQHVFYRAIGVASATGVAYGLALGGHGAEAGIGSLPYMLHGLHSLILSAWLGGLLTGMAFFGKGPDVSLAAAVPSLLRLTGAALLLFTITGVAAASFHLRGPFAWDTEYAAVLALKSTAVVALATLCVWMHRRWSATLRRAPADQGAWVAIETWWSIGLMVTFCIVLLATLMARLPTSGL